MARFPTRQKVHRVVDFMLGMRHPRVVVAMRSRAYTEKDHQEGLALLAQALRGRFDVTALHDPNPLAAFRAWKEEWYPFAKSVISLRFPEHEEAVFRNLGAETDDAAVVMLVDTLVTRLTALPPEVRQVLAIRGLDDAVLEEARELGRAFESIGQGTEPTVDHQAEAAAIDALWRWYRDWSAMARSVITDRRLLRALGFHRPAAEKEEADLETNT